MSPAYYTGAAKALLAALETKSKETGLHAYRVARLAAQLGLIVGLEEQQLNTLRFGALLHDVGKLGVPDAILKKASQLTEDEWGQMRQHPEIGCQLLLSLGFPGAVALIVAQHHERWDGTGYPDRLAHSCICRGARIFAVVDTYDSLTRDRCYRKGVSHELACKEIADWAGRQFDPEVVDAFLKTPKEVWQKCGASC
jgi:putative nucleotidyltransferase with HDIG domain